jgi:hypothetical protein
MEILSGGEMNGSGKPGITRDLSGVADFVAHAHIDVHLSLESAPGTVGLTKVRYDSRPIEVHENRFRLTILEGIKPLEITVIRQVPGLTALRDWEGNTLASFDTPQAQFRIRGE